MNIEKTFDNRYSQSIEDDDGFYIPENKIKGNSYGIHQG